MIKTKIICTLGPGSDKDEIIKKLAERGMDYARINLSHASLDYFKELAIKIKKIIKVPLIIDTEGSQIRTGPLKSGAVVLIEDDDIKVYDTPNENNLSFTPKEVIHNLEVGNLASVDFNSALLKVADVQNKNSGYITCKVINGGVVGSNKAVTIDSRSLKLPVITEKDKAAIEFGLNNGINFVAFSFISGAADMKYLREIYGKSINYMAKVETKPALNEIDQILDLSDAILIDRGDLGKEVSIEKVPLIQKLLIQKCHRKGKPVYIATNLLDSMMSGLKPTRAEVNDIINTVIDGATGLVLAAETAVGKNPVETLSMLVKLCGHAELVTDIGDIGIQVDNDSNKVIKRLEELNYLTSPVISGSLIEPHGGRLVNRILPEPQSREYLDSLTKIKVDQQTLMDAEQIAIGTFSPLEGFMNKKDYEGVLNNMRLSDGTVWTIPIILSVDEKTSSGISIGQTVALALHGNEIYALLYVDDKYRFDKLDAVRKLFGTDDKFHPGVQSMLKLNDILIGGKVDMIKRLPSEYKHYELTPAQARKIFEEKGWSKIAGFHTRNVIHSSHEYTQLRTLEKENCDGLFIHPVVGKKKYGDFAAGMVIKSYEIMQRLFYPKNKVVFAAFATFSRYAGPREAVFTAICRKNFGCSHFIVGRDHTGVGNFYGPYDSQAIFNRFNDLGITPIFFKDIFYCEKCSSHADEDNCTHDEKYRIKISGSDARKMLELGVMPPNNFMRPEISKMIIDSIKKGEEVFIK